MQTPDPQLLHDVFNASPIGIVVENMDGQPLFVNPAFCIFLGFTEEELHSKHCVDFSPPEDAAKDWALFQQLRAGSIDRYQLEKRYFRKDGSSVWGSLNISRLNSHPSPLVIAIVDDITAKKAAEEARFRHAAIVESSQDAIISKNLETRITSWNAGAERIFGYTEEEAVGQSITIIIPPHLQDEENEILARLRAGDRIEHYETKRLTKTGKEVDVSLIIGPIRDATGSLAGFSKIAHDITERKRAQEALQQREMESKEAQRLAGVGSWQWEPRTDTVIWSKELYHLMGIDSTLPAPSYKEHAQLFTAESWERLQRAVQGALKTGTSYELDLEVVRPESIAKWEIARGEPVRDKSGQIIGLRGTVQDITERKRAGKALTNMSRKLVEAQEKERARIARELHDDINQRLAMLSVELEQLQDNPSEVRRRVQELRKHVTEISDDVQALSHELHSSKLEYLGAIGGMKSWCKEFGERGGLQIEFKSTPGETFVAPEVGISLFRVLQEALHNAAKHSGVRRIDVQLREDSGEIHLIVSDLGKGFDVEKAVQGRGLGLASMQERMRLVGGKLSISSQAKGTTIHARVPLGDHPIRAAG